MLVTLHDLSFTYDDSPEPVFNGISATLSQGWTGIVGDNGSGKSTLLRVITGELQGYQGQITPKVSGVYCPQPTETPPEAGEEFSLTYDSDAIRLRQILGVDEDWIWRFDTLSHGERKRLQIAVALWQNPVLLALDEPTNHVDAATRDKLLLALKDFRGIGLLVSHDRELLDALTSQCLFLERGQATMRPGAYSSGVEQSDLERGALASERKNAKAQLSRLHAEKARRAEAASHADARRSKRNIDPKDHAAKAKIDLAIFTGQDGQAGKLSSQMNAQLASAEARLESAFVSKRYEGEIWVQAHAAKRKTLVKLDAASLKMGEKELTIPDLYVGNTDHIGLWGENGSGKSTLIAHLMQSLPDEIEKRSLYIPQELTKKQSQKILEDVKDLSSEEQGRLFSIVAQLNSSPKRILSGDDLSPGELRKVMLALGIMRDPYLIIMDEPTNHLDIHSIEALERVLKDCPCALVLVSHDAPFLRALTTTRWEFSSIDNDETHIAVAVRTL